MSMLKKTIVWPFYVVFSVFFFGLFQPGNYSDVGYMFFYPLYDDTVIQSLFTCGSWMTIYFLVWFMDHECNKTFNTNVYKLFTGSSMSLYLCHDLWIQIVIACLIWPFVPRNDGNMSFYLGLALVIILTESLSLLNFLAFGKLYSLLVPQNLKA